MSTSIRVLTVDDDALIRSLLSMYLKKEGYTVDEAADGQEAIDKVRQTKYDIVLLDIMMPVMDGLEALQEIRKFSNVPVILLTAKGSPEDTNKQASAMLRAEGLDTGADDYITKPFESAEVISRIKAILRRSQTDIKSDKDIFIDNLFVSITNYIVKLDGVKIEMPPKEIELLHFLATHPQKVYTRDELLEAIWDTDYKGDSRTVDVHIKRIRERLKDNDNSAVKSWKIQTVYTVGYKFDII